MVKKYEVGDKVKIRTDLERKYYDLCSVVLSMMIYKGELKTIERVINTNRYKLEGVEYTWSAEMFEGSDKPERIKIEGADW